MANEDTNPAPWPAIRFLHRLEDGLLVLLLLSIVALAFGQIVLRNILDTGYIWIDPMIRVLVLWVGMFGALVATRENRQISIDVLTRLLPPLLKSISQIITRLFASVIAGLIAWHSALFVIDEWETGSRAFANIPAWLLESIIPFGFGLIALRYLLEALSGAARLFLGRPS